MKACLSNKVPTMTKVLLSITAVACTMELVIGRVSEFVNPGPNGSHVTQDWQDSAMGVCRAIYLALVLVYVPYQNDCIPESAKATDMINGLVLIYDRIVLVFDTHHSCRWDQRGLDPVRCLGDVSFHTNDTYFR